jgi:hypothetical protein
MIFPLSEQEWYEARDDRTNRVNGATGFEDFSLEVIVNPRIKASYPLQVMTVTSLNMLARWCRKIRIQLPNTLSYLPSNRGDNFEKFLQEHLQMIDPYGQFTFGKIDSECAHTLFIGSPEKEQEQLANHSVWIDGGGWISGIGNGAPSMEIKLENDLNPVGAAFASCLGVAELFRQAVGLPSSTEGSSWYSLYHLNKINDKNGDMISDYYLPSFDFGRIYQVGCGAVASSLDFLLSLTDWKAEICLIDYDRVEITNCNRSLAFTAYDAVKNRSKVDSCGDALRSSIVPRKFEGSYGEFVKAKNVLNLPADLVLCLANEQNVWATIQSNLPPLTLHATTTPNWGVNFGRHIPKKEWCIMCRFSKKIEHAFKPVCGEVEIRSPSENQKTVLGVLPFLSATAAVLILAEMAKIPLSKYPANNDFVEFSTKSNGTDFLQQERKATKTCVCNGQSPELFEHVTKTKFWRFSI